MAFLISLLEHPVLFTIFIIGILVFIGQTYEFILYLTGKKKDNELTDDELEPFNQMKSVIDNDYKEEDDNKNKHEYIYDDNTNGVYK